MLMQEAWAARIPHAGAMALIDAVRTWNTSTIHAIAVRRTRYDHPLRSPAGLHAVHLVEYGVQATAVHGALLDETSGRAGRLVSLRQVQWAIEYVDLASGSLDIHAHRLLANQRSALYSFEVEQEGQWLISGHATVMYTD